MLQVPPVAPPTVPGGVCNSEWPNDSTYSRFLWVVDYLISQVWLPATYLGTAFPSLRLCSDHTGTQPFAHTDVTQELTEHRAQYRMVPGSRELEA